MPSLQSGWDLRSLPCACGRARGGVFQAVLGFETTSARCSAVLRLRDGKCWTLMTAIAELKGHEESIGARRPNGAPARYARGRENRKTLRDRQKAESGCSRQPYCLIVGAGHAGLGLGARLKQLGVPTLIVDRRERPSDTWRNRHASLSLHSPVWFDHMPYLPFPASWPRFPSKDQFADWLDGYAAIMDLDVWTGAECVGCRHDAASGEWRVAIVRNGRMLKLRPKQLVLATGHSETPSTPDIPGRDQFKGKQLHAATLPVLDSCNGLKSVVIGAGISAHDVAAQLWEAGSEVTMIRRGPTIVMGYAALMTVLGIYNTDEPGRPRTEITDLLVASVPHRLTAQFQAPMIAAAKRDDAALYEGLRKAGFRHDFGEDNGGIVSRMAQNPGGHYINVGAADLIAAGDIAVRSGVSVAAIRPHSIVLSDGSELAADILVYATGYHKTTAALTRLLPEDVVRKLGPLGGIGSGFRGDHGPWAGESRNIWKPTAQPNLWFHCFNLGPARMFSRILALQIKARHAGLATPVYPSMDPPAQTPAQAARTPAMN